MRYQFNPTSSNEWMRTPHIRNAYKTLMPLVSDSPWSPALGPAHLPWLFLKTQPKNFPRVTAAGHLVLLPHQSRDLVVERAEVAKRARRVPVHRRLRLHRRRDQSLRRRAAARIDRSRKPAAHPHRRHQVQPEFLAPRGLGAAREAARAGRRHARHDRHRDRARAPGRHPQGVRRRHQQGRRRHVAADRGGTYNYALDRRSAAQKRRGVGRGLQGGLARGQRRQGGPRSRLVPRARLHAAPVPADRLVSLSGAGEAGPALRAALSGAAHAPRPGARAPAQGNRHRLVGEAARGIRVPADLRTLPRYLAQLRQGIRPRSRRLSALGDDRALVPIRLGRQCRHSADPRGRRQHRRPQGRHRQPQDREADGHRRRRRGRDRIGHRHHRRQGRAARGHPARLRADDRPVRSLEDAVRQGPASAELELGEPTAPAAAPTAARDRSAPHLRRRRASRRAERARRDPLGHGHRREPLRRVPDLHDRVQARERHAAGRAVAEGRRRREGEISRTSSASSSSPAASIAPSRPACRCARPAPPGSARTGSSSRTTTSASAAPIARSRAPIRRAPSRTT